MPLQAQRPTIPVPKKPILKNDTKSPTPKRHRSSSPSDNSSVDENDNDNDNDNGTASESDSGEGSTGAPPPIYIKDKSHWPSIQDYLTTEDIPCRRAVNTSDSVKVHVHSVSDFRSLTRKLESDNIPYTTHQLRQGKDLIVVIRGVIESQSDEDIRTELDNKKFPVRLPHEKR